MSRLIRVWFKGSASGVFKAAGLMVLLLVTTSLWAMDTTRSGSFKGLSNHITTGTASLVKEGDGYVIQLGEDFTFDGAPDPKVAFGKDGKFDSNTILEPLKSNNGSQSYSVPASLNPEDYNEIYIWCERYSVGLGVASIK